MALLCWLLSVLGGVHAHVGGEPGHGHGHSHATGHNLHSVLDASHEAHHAEALEVDAGVDPLLSVVNAGKVVELPLLGAVALLLVLLSLYSGLLVPTLPRKPPRPPRQLRPPLRAPPIRPA